MDATRIVSTPEEIKALAHPLRQRILEAMIAEPITTKQVADLLGEKPTKLYHHVDSLADAGLVRLVTTRRKRGTIEKYFQAVAQRFVVDRDAVEVGPTPTGEERAELEGVIVASLDETLIEIRDGIASGLIEAEESVFVRSHLRASARQMAELLGRLQEWIRECQQAHEPEGEVEYGVTLAVYPTRLGE